MGGVSQRRSTHAAGRTGMPRSGTPLPGRRLGSAISPRQSATVRRMRFFRRRPRRPDTFDVARVPQTFAEACASASDRDVLVRAAAGVLLASHADIESVVDLLVVV